MQLRIRYVVIYGLLRFKIFSTLSHKRHDFRKQFIEHKICVSIFSITFIWNVFQSKKDCARYDQKCVLVFKYSISYYCKILMKTEFSRKFFEKLSTFIFYDYSFSWSRVVPSGQTDGQTDGRTDMTKLTVAFRNFANSSKKVINLFLKCQINGLLVTSKILNKQ
jgi:hypothetical protein